MLVSTRDSPGQPFARVSEYRGTGWADIALRVMVLRRDMRSDIGWPGGQRDEGVGAVSRTAVGCADLVIDRVFACDTDKAQHQLTAVMQTGRYG